MSQYYKHSTEYEKIKNVTIVSVFVNILISAGKILGGLKAGSYALIADGIHSLSDLVTDFLLFFGVKFWTKPKDQSHPYGHRRIEDIITILIGVFLAYAGYQIVYYSVTKVKAESNSICIEALIISFFSIIIKEMLFRYTLKTGKEIHSQAVIANAWHHRSDVFSSIPVFISLFVATFYKSYEFMDKIGAIIVGFIILKVAWDLVSSSFERLSDKSADNDIVRKISEIALNIEGVKDVHAIRTRYLGNSIALDMHILVDKDMTVFDGHNKSGEVKKDIFEKIPGISDIIIHIEPYEE